VLAIFSSPCIAIVGDVYRTQEAKVVKSSRWQGAMMVNSHW